MFKVLVVEDDKDLNQTVCAYLNRNGYDAIGCLSANDAYNEFHEQIIDMIISDIMMPEIDGYEFAGTIREMNQDIPILFMTAREDLESKRRGFGMGVDDYMVKPIDLDELLLRVEALLRRAKIATNRKITIGSTVLDIEEHSAYVGDEEIPLTVREFNILYKLFLYPKKTFTRSQLMDEFWDIESASLLLLVTSYCFLMR